MEQKSDAWHEERRQYINASEAGGLLGLSPYTSASAAEKAWVRKFHGHRTNFSSPDMDRGNRLEPVALEAYEEGHNVIVLQDGGRTHAGWLRASADGWVDGESRGVEVKAPRKFFNPDDRLDYLLQMFLQGIAYEWDRVTMVQIVENGSDLSVELKETGYSMDELHAKFPDALNQLSAMWSRLTKAPPPEEETVFTSEEWEIAQSRYTSAKLAADEAKAAADEARDALLEAAGHEPVRGDRWMVVEATRTGSLNANKLATDHPEIDLNAYRGAPTTSLSVRKA